MKNSKVSNGRNGRNCKQCEPTFVILHFNEWIISICTNGNSFNRKKRNSAFEKRVACVHFHRCRAVSTSIIFYSPTWCSIEFYSHGSARETAASCVLILRVAWHWRHKHVRMCPHSPERPCWNACLRQTIEWFTAEKRQTKRRKKYAMPTS